MPDGETHAVVEFIHGLVADADLASQTDNQLLKRFLASRDENAFEALVRRHGPMVLAPCGRILRDPQDAEDAFQAALVPSGNRPSLETEPLTTENGRDVRTLAETALGGASGARPQDDRGAPLAHGAP
jgi:hypothetical protein